MRGKCPSKSTCYILKYALHSKQCLLKRNDTKAKLYLKTVFWLRNSHGSLEYSLLTAAPVQLPPQLPRDGLQVHEVAEASPCALPAGEQTGSCGACPPHPAQGAPGACTHLPHLVLAAAGFSEVGHRGELGVDRLAIKPAVVQVNHGLFRIFFTAKLKRQGKNVAAHTSMTNVFNY